MGTNGAFFSATGGGRVRVSGLDTRRFPVEQVSWDDALEFCRRLSGLPEEKAASRVYRLPSEAQWEYACRAGSAGGLGANWGRGVRLAEWGHELTDYAWFNQTSFTPISGVMPHAVGGKRANGWGLYDMLGSVWEWCTDWYDKDYYARSAADDPTGPPQGDHRIHRGGNFTFSAETCQPSQRHADGPRQRVCWVGFRVAFDLPGK